MSTKAKNPVRATEKSLRILEILMELRRAGVTEIAEELGASKGTVHHHLSTLEEHGYVVKSGTSYRLGMRLFEMGESARRETGIYEVAKPELDALAKETGELANLMIEERGQGVYIYISRGPQAVTLDTKVGTRQYLHTSALGKAILANFPRDRLNEIIAEHGLPAETPNTVTTRKELMAELETIRDRGVAFDGEERAEGIRCIAAPVTTSTGTLIGAVSVSGPSTRIKGDRLEKEIPEQVRNTANVIGINASYS